MTRIYGDSTGESGYLWRIRDKRTGRYIKGWNHGTTVWFSTQTAKRALKHYVWDEADRHNYEIVKFELKETTDGHNKTD